MTTCSSDSMDPYLGFAELKQLVCDFEIPLKCFRSSAVVNLVAATLDLPVLIV